MVLGLVFVLGGPLGMALQPGCRNHEKEEDNHYSENEFDAHFLSNIARE